MEITTKKDVLKFSLNKNELYFLRLFIHNYSFAEIKSFLSLPQGLVLDIERGLFQKLKVNTSYMLAARAFNEKLVSDYDFADEFSKKICLNMTSAIIERNKEKEVGSELVDELVELLNSYKQYIDNNVKASNNELLLNETEIAFLKLKLSEEASLNDTIGNKIKDSSSITSSGLIKESTNSHELILIKLKANSWYNAYVKAIELQLMEKPKIFEKKVEVKMNSCKRNILSILDRKSISEKDRYNNIYRELVSLLVCYGKLY